MKVRTLCILCNNCCLFRPRYLTPVWLGVALYTVLGQVSSPGQVDRLHTNRDRSSQVIESIIYDNLSLKNKTVHNLKQGSQIQNYCLHFEKKRDEQVGCKSVSELQLKEINA